MKKGIAIVFGLILAGVAACGGTAPAPTNAPAPTQAAAVTQVAAPTQAPKPTDAPKPTEALPTDAPKPTDAPAATVASEPTQAAAPTTAAGGDVKPPEGAPSDVVSKAMLNVFNADSVRAKTLISFGGQKQTLVLEYIKPDRMRLVQGEDGEQIAIKGKGMWKKTGDTWESQGAEMADMLFGFIDPAAVQETLKSIKVESVKFVGPELLDGKPTFVYTYETSVDLGGVTNKGVGKVWIGALDGRIYRADSESDSLSSPGSKDTTQAIYEYNIPLTIEAPQ